MFVEIENRNEIRILSINRPPVNAINIQVVSDLNQRLSDAKIDKQVSGVILTGLEGYFSAGLDVIELFPLRKAEIRIFWNGFYKLLQLIYTFPKPLFSALSGHSPAGGTVMAIMTDYRLMASGDFSIGLNEVSVGLVIPNSIAEIFSSLVGRRNAELMALNGSLISPDQALKWHLIDEMCPQNQLINRSVDKMTSWLELPAQQQMMTKMEFRKPIIEKMKMNMEFELDELQNIWFSKEFQTAMGRLVADLTKGK